MPSGGDGIEFSEFLRALKDIELLAEATDTDSDARAEEKGATIRQNALTGHDGCTKPTSCCDGYSSRSSNL